jgi:hypothetical protein
MAAVTDPADAAPTDIERATRFQKKNCENLATDKARADCYKDETEAVIRSHRLINLYKGLAFGGGLLLLATIALILTLKLTKTKRPI